MSAAADAQLIVLGGVIGLELFTASRLLGPPASGSPRRSPLRRLGYRIGVLASLSATAGLVIAVGLGVGWATIALCVGVALWALEPARQFSRGLVRGIWADDHPAEHPAAQGVGALALFVPAVFIPVGVLVYAHPDVSRGWVAAWVGLAVGVSLGMRRMSFLRLLIPDVWPDETLDVLDPCLTHLLAAPVGAVLSVSHKGGRRILGLERVKPPGGEPYTVEVILWNDARPYEQLSRAIDAMSSVSSIITSGPLVPEGYPTQSCRVSVPGTSETIRATAHALAEAAWRGFELTESARVRYTLARNAEADLAMWKASAQPAS